ncbi:MAG: STAS domain-containing protein [Leptospirales bacterium]|nr:STAS domain-containing protein [Leptospirales bacterium]
MLNSIDSDSDNIFVMERTNDVFQKSILEKKVDEFIKSVKNELILDLQELDTLDSVTLAALIRFKRKLTETDRTLKLINYNENIVRIIDMAGLGEFFLD